MPEEAPQPSVRSRVDRTADTLERLSHDVDLWVASASEDGRAYLVPLSYHWDGSTLTIATPSASPTARNLIRAGWGSRRARADPRRRDRRRQGRGDPDRRRSRARGCARAIDGVRSADARGRVRLPADRPAGDPGVARVERAGGPRPDARWSVAGVGQPLSLDRFGSGDQ